jgi:hypothetical protein
MKNIICSIFLSLIGNILNAQITHTTKEEDYAATSFTGSQLLSIKENKTINSSPLEACIGDACGAISVTPTQDGGTLVRNNGTQTVVVSIKWYYAQCQEYNTYTLSAYESFRSPFPVHCPPYQANYKK